jgi:iron(III) transport system substrate-binding protein
MTRRRFLLTLAFGTGAALLAACQQQGPVAPAKPDAVANKTAAKAQADWEKRWNDLIAAAKQEGKLVMSGPPTPEVRKEVPEAFKRRFGIDVEYIGGRTTELMSRLQSERKVGQYTLDALVAGAQSLYTVAYPDKMLDPIPPVLVHPEALDGTKWMGGRPWFMDPEQQYILRLANYVSSLLAVNTQFVKAEEITTYRDLLDPKFRGKVSAYDPIRPGTGWNTANYLLSTLGDDYIRSLFQTQQLGVSNDNRQLSDWMARGQYPVSIGLGSDEVERLKTDGFPVAVIRDTPDVPGYVTAGFGLAALMNQPPHPNAARLFTNWIAMKEGNEVYCRNQVIASVRTDVDNGFAPQYVIPRPGVKYFDTYDWDFTVNSRRPEEVERLKQLTGVS